MQTGGMRNRDVRGMFLVLVNGGERYCRWVDAAVEVAAEHDNTSVATRAMVHVIRHIGVSRFPISRLFWQPREHITAADRSNKCTTHLGGK